MMWAVVPVTIISKIVNLCLQSSDPRDQHLQPQQLALIYRRERIVIAMNGSVIPANALRSDLIAMENMIVATIRMREAVVSL